MSKYTILKYFIAFLFCFSMGSVNNSFGQALPKKSTIPKAHTKKNSSNKVKNSQKNSTPEQTLHTAAEQGDAQAQYELGYAYYKGNDAIQNYYEAVKWFRKAAEQGSVAAQTSLGICYHLGKGVNLDYYEAVKLFYQAAEKGYAPAQSLLGKSFFSGLGVEVISYSEGVKWYRKAAEQGYAPSQYDLGICYLNGEGVDKDISIAKIWFEKAASQGNNNAISVLKNLK